MGSGYFTGTTDNKYISAKVEWSSETDRQLNKSTVTAIFYVRKSSQSSEATTGEGSWTLVINGVSKKVTKRVDVPNNNAWVEIIRNTVEVEHEQDGSKLLQIVATGGTLRTTWKSTNCSSAVELDFIPRQTLPTFDGVDTCDFGSNLTIILNPSDDSFVHDVWFQWQDAKTKIRSGFEWGAFEYTIPTEIMNDIPNSIAAIAYIVTDTYSNGELVGSTVAPITLTVPESIVPTIDSIVISDSGSVIPHEWGILVQGKSEMHVKASGSGVYGSKIIGVSIEALDKAITSDEGDFGVILNSGSVSAKVTVIDSRGRSATETGSRSVESYSAPIISDISIERANDQGTPVDNGSYLRMLISSSIASLGGYNSMTVKVFAFRSDGDSWELVRTVIPEGTTLNDYIVMVANMEPSRSFDIDVKVSDVFGAETIVSGVLPAEGGVISWIQGGTGVSFGKTAEEPYQADFAWRIHARQGAKLDIPLGVGSGGTGGRNPEEARYYLGISDKNLVDIIYPVGSIYMTTNNVNPMNLFVGTRWEKIEGRFLIGASEGRSAGSTGGQSSVTIEEANHKHSIIGRSQFTANSASTADNHLLTETKESGGWSKTIDLIPPYFAVNMWRRLEDRDIVNFLTSDGETIMDTNDEKFVIFEE